MNSGDAVPKELLPEMITKNFDYSSSSPSGRERDLKMISNSN